jgi:hypothetical protein
MRVLQIIYFFVVGIPAFIFAYLAINFISFMLRILDI